MNRINRKSIFSGIFYSAVYLPNGHFFVAMVLNLKPLTKEVK